MKVLLVHNDYGKYSGEEAVVDKMVSFLLAGLYRHKHNGGLYLPFSLAIILFYGLDIELLASHPVVSPAPPVAWVCYTVCAISLSLFINYIFSKTRSVRRLLYSGLTLKKIN